jgi:hypothetical protein
MPMMRTEEQVKAMLKKFDDADVKGDPDGGQLDSDQEIVRDTLLWVLGHRSDADLDEFLEDM